MSDFQIPGLGQAKLNETLPPLPPSLAPASVTYAENLPTAPRPPEQSHDHDIHKTETQELVQPSTITADAADAMVIDQKSPASPPSLTSALEAAIGGLDYEQPQSLQNHPQRQTTTSEAVSAEVATEAAAEAAAVEAVASQAESETLQLQPDTSQHPEWEIDSSPYQSSSESSSDSSSSDEDDSDDNEGYELLGVEETARMLMEAEGGSDDEAGGTKAGTGSGQLLRTKNELADDAVLRPDVTITEAMMLEELGTVKHIVETTVVVMGFTPGEYQVLDAGSVLCTADRVVIGAVAETMGKVTRPMYTVRFNTVDEMQGLGVAIGTTLYYTPAHATFVLTAPLKHVKGSDASNLHDEEAADEDMDFSDDEKEAEYKRTLKQRKRDKWKANNPDKATTAVAVAAGAGMNQENSLRPPRQQNVDGGLNYDDDNSKDGVDDGPYKPLARPPSLASGPGSSQYDQLPTQRGGRYQGRGGSRRGGDGRGGRGGGGRGGRGGGVYSRGGRGGSHASPNHGDDSFSMGSPLRHSTMTQQQQQAAAQPWMASVGGGGGGVPQGNLPPGMQFQGGWSSVSSTASDPLNLSRPLMPFWPGSVMSGQQQQQQQQQQPQQPHTPMPSNHAGSGYSSGFNLDPAVLAAIMSQVQAQTGASQQQSTSSGGRQQPAPPSWGGGHPQPPFYPGR